MTQRSQSRKHRGSKTQRLLAERWRKNGMAPYAVPAGAGEQGNDIHNIPGLAVEIKARDSVSFPAALRQAAAGGPGLPVVIARHNGQGLASMDTWTVTLNLVDFEYIHMLLRGLQLH